MGWWVGEIIGSRAADNRGGCRHTYTHFYRGETKVGNYDVGNVGVFSKDRWANSTAAGERCCSTGYLIEAVGRNFGTTNVDGADS